MIAIIFFINKNQVFNIRVTQNHHQSLRIIKNYPILSDPFEKKQPLADACVQSKDPGSNLGTVECGSFSTERFQILEI